MTHPVVISIQVGKPQTFNAGHGEVWRSAIVKQPVNHPVFLGKTNLEGDGQADLTFHGGPDKAVLVYDADHYAKWRQELMLSEFPYGGLGENFTVTGLDEHNVCIGDVYRIGEAVVQVPQPRMTCWKPARLWGVPDLVRRIKETGRTGWYLRVLEEGRVASGERMELMNRPCPQWTIARCNDVVYSASPDRAEWAELADCPYLADSWIQMLKRRLQNEAGLADEGVSDK